MTSGACVRQVAGDGWRLSANFAMFETLSNQPSAVFLCGRTIDRVVEEDGTLRFAERIFVFHSTIVPASLVYPI